MNTLSDYQTVLDEYDNEPTSFRRKACLWLLHPIARYRREVWRAAFRQLARNEVILVSVWEDILGDNPEYGAAAQRYLTETYPTLEQQTQTALALLRRYGYPHPQPLEQLAKPSVLAAWAGFINLTPIGSHF